MMAKTRSDGQATDDSPRQHYCLRRAFQVSERRAGKGASLQRTEEHR